MDQLVNRFKRIFAGEAAEQPIVAEQNEVPEEVPQGPRRAAIKHFDGLSVEIHPGDTICHHIEGTGTWEEGLSERLIDIGKEGGLLVDVGANIGYFSMLWAKSNPANHSLAFEASPRIFPKLTQHVNENQLASQISPFAVALSDSCTIHEFVLGPEEQTGWGGLTHTPNGPSTKVIAMRLDELLGDEEIRVLKIDVEGADTWVLKGCDRLLREGKVKEIFYEQNHPRMAEIGIDPEEAGNYLKQFGYKVENITTLDDQVVEWHAYFE